jgi:hypothetical protein
LLFDAKGSASKVNASISSYSSTLKDGVGVLCGEATNTYAMATKDLSLVSNAGGYE